MTFKLGLVGLCTSHPECWVPVIRDLVREGQAEVEIVAAWDSGETRPEGFAAEFCEKLQISHAVEQLDQMVGLVDGVIVHTANWDRHLEQARPFIEAGKSVFLDKPVAGNFGELNQVLSWIGRGCRLTGGSVLRYTSEIAALHDRLQCNQEEIGTAYTSIGVDEFNYGVHGYAILLAVMGGGVQSVRYLGSSNQRQVMLTWSDGRRGLITLGQSAWLPFHVTVTTNKNVHQVQIDTSRIYRSMLEKVLPYLSGMTDIPPLPAGELLEPEFVALAAKQSWENDGQEVFLSDLDATSTGYNGTEFAREYKKKCKG